MNKTQQLLFLVLGSLALIMQFFSVYIVLILIAVITHKWALMSIIAVVITAAETYRFRTLKKLGLVPKKGEQIQSNTKQLGKTDLTPYINRLTEEWRQHGNIVIGVDFDDTISPWKLANQEECDKVIHTLKEAKNVGAHIVVFTACKEDRYEQILAYCKKKDLRVDAINKNPIDLPYGNTTKIYANIFLDDRAGLESALVILNESMYRQRSYKRSQVQLDEIG